MPSQENVENHMGGFKGQAWKWHISLLSYTTDQKSITQPYLTARMARKQGFSSVPGKRMCLVEHLAGLCYMPTVVSQKKFQSLALIHDSSNSFKPFLPKRSHLQFHQVLFICSLFPNLNLLLPRPLFLAKQSCFLLFFSK